MWVLLQKQVGQDWLKTGQTGLTVANSDYFLLRSLSCLCIQHWTVWMSHTHTHTKLPNWEVELQKQINSWPILLKVWPVFCVGLSSPACPHYFWVSTSISQYVLTAMPLWSNSLACGLCYCWHNSRNLIKTKLMEKTYKNCLPWTSDSTALSCTSWDRPIEMLWGNTESPVFHYGLVASHSWNHCSCAVCLDSSW